LQSLKYLLSDVLHSLKEFTISVELPVMCGEVLVEHVFSIIEEKFNFEEELYAISFPNPESDPVLLQNTQYDSFGIFDDVM
jgi:hypothetical protein